MRLLAKNSLLVLFSLLLVVPVFAQEDIVTKVVPLDRLSSGYNRSFYSGAGAADDSRIDQDSLVLIKSLRGGLARCQTNLADLQKQLEKPGATAQQALQALKLAPVPQVTFQTAPTPNAPVKTISITPAPQLTLNLSPTTQQLAPQRTTPPAPPAPTCPKVDEKSSSEVFYDLNDKYPDCGFGLLARKQAANEASASKLSQQSQQILSLKAQLVANDQAARTAEARRRAEAEKERLRKLKLLEDELARKQQKEKDIKTVKNIAIGLDTIVRRIEIPLTSPAGILTDAIRSGRILTKAANDNKVAEEAVDLKAIDIELLELQKKANQPPDPLEIMLAGLDEDKSIREVSALANAAVKAYRALLNDAARLAKQIAKEGRGIREAIRGLTR